MRDGLTNTQGLVKDPNGGCFCLGKFPIRLPPVLPSWVVHLVLFVVMKLTRYAMTAARIHELSTYTPICRQCGLILCSLNMPYFACPHCTSRLLTDAARESLITSLETQISDTLAKQERARQQAVEDARKAAGAFPSLGTATTPAPLNPFDSSPVNQTHKVLSLNSKTRKIKVESRKTVTTSSSPASASDAENQVAEKVPPRIPHPPPDVVVPSDPPSSDRLWARLDNHDVMYVPPPKTASQKSNKAGKGKMKREAGADGGHGSSSGVNKPA